ncbi:MAG: META domain-containing protein [Candidatus Eremiobacteraeota bacterium]|nr:META domain-containing protein [Candidatus Eremiobacteraeota bacterium]
MKILKGGLFIALLMALPWSTVVAKSDGTSIPLGGTSWQMVQFKSADDKVIKPHDPSKYTVTFSPDGNVSTQVDCNRGHGMWKSPGPNQLQLTPMALTRAFCFNDNIGDRFARDWEHITSYTVQHGHLFLAVKLDSGIYEFQTASGLPVAVAPPQTFHCSHGAENATFTVRRYESAPRLILLRYENETRPVFQVPAPSGAKFQGEDVSFSDAGEQTVITWSGKTFKCASAP